MVHKRRRKVNKNLEITANLGASQTYTIHGKYTNCEDNSAISEFQYKRDKKNRRIITKDLLCEQENMPTSHEEPKTQTQENETLKCQEEPPMPVQLKPPSPPLQPSWTSGHWLKPGEMSTQPQKPAANDMPKALAMKRIATQRQKQLTNILSKPVEMSKAERMMQKMGWSGGALGKTGKGIVEPIMPNLIYANDNHGLGLSFEKPVKSKPPKSTATQKAQKPKPPSKVEKRQLNKVKRKADKIVLKTNALKVILDFVKNDNETEIVFDSHLLPFERQTIHQLVNDVIPSDSGGPLGAGLDNFVQLDLLEKIREFNSLILKTQSYGDKTNRKLHIFKEAPSHVFLITPDDLIDQGYEFDEEINESDLESDKDYNIEEDKTNKETKEKKTSDNNDSNTSDREDKKDDENNDEINESDLESDDDYNIVGKETNKETKEKEVHSSSVVCGNKSNIPEIENDKDRPSEHTEKQVIVENKLPTVQQTDKEDEKNNENYDEINESDLESDDDYNIVGKETNEETKEKELNSSSVVCSNRSNIPDIENDKDRPTEHTEKQVIVENKLPTVQQTDKEGEKNDENYDEINESDLESDDDYNIVGKETNKETKEKELNSSSVVCSNRSNISDIENDKDRPTEHTDKQAIVENKPPTVQQTVDTTEFTNSQNSLDEKAKNNPNTSNCEEKSTDDVTYSPRKRKLSVAQQLSLSWAETDLKQTKNEHTESENNRYDTTKCDNLAQKELNLQNTEKEGTEVDSQIKSDEACSEIDVTRFLKEFFIDFAQDEAYTELRFVGPFLDDDIQKINELVTVVFYCVRDGVCKDDRFREILDCLNNRDFTFEVTQNYNGNPLIHKHKIEANTQKDEVIEIE